jgi:hypothetical protein
MPQTVTITNDSDRPIIVVPFDESAAGQREDVSTIVLPGRATRLIVHELRYLAVYGEPGDREPAPAVGELEEGEEGAAS